MYGVAGAVIAVAYVLRAVGDVGTPALTWLSPIGWYQAHAPLLRPALVADAAAARRLAAALAGAAYALFARRDYGAGVLAARPGPGARRRPSLSTPLGLAWRLQRGAVIGWTGGHGPAGLAYGSIGDDVGTLIGDSRRREDVFVQWRRRASSTASTPPRS